ncbi:MAG: hypothetical protein ACR2GY_11195 [Phycisphaerales bacterium]
MGSDSLARTRKGVHAFRNPFVVLILAVASVVVITTVLDRCSAARTEKRLNAGLSQLADRLAADQVDDDPSTQVRALAESNIRWWDSLEPDVIATFLIVVPVVVAFVAIFLQVWYDRHAERRALAIEMYAKFDSVELARDRRQAWQWCRSDPRHFELFAEYTLNVGDVALKPKQLARCQSIASVLYFFAAVDQLLAENAIDVRLVQLLLVPRFRSWYVYVVRPASRALDQCLADHPSLAFPGILPAWSDGLNQLVALSKQQ